MMPKVKRIKDPKAIRAAQRIHCQLCGRTGIIHVHHIKTRGSGGHDIPDNLISLCVYCHAKVHTGEIGKEQLREAKRLEEGHNA